MQNPRLKKSYLKIISTIKSCNSIIQLDGASRMIENFKMLYKQVGYPKIILYNLDKALKQQYIITRCQL